MTEDLVMRGTYTKRLVLMLFERGGRMPSREAREALETEGAHFRLCVARLSARGALRRDGGDLVLLNKGYEWCRSHTAQPRWLTEAPALKPARTVDVSRVPRSVFDLGALGD